MKRTRRLSCKSKQQYNSKNEADRAMRSFFRRTMGGVVTNAEVYPCGDHYHWGHFRNRKR